MTFTSVVWVGQIFCSTLIRTSLYIIILIILITYFIYFSRDCVRYYGHIIKLWFRYFPFVRDPFVVIDLFRILVQLCSIDRHVILLLCNTNLQ